MSRPTGTKKRGAGSGGFTLVEMLVVLAVLAILAAVTVPYAEVAVKREKELELRRDLREMRTAIDRFHEDWRSGTLSKLESAVSDDGYPKTLRNLVEGMDLSGPPPLKRKYLRRIPENPMGNKELGPADQWCLRGYRDRSDATQWGGGDVWDVYCPGGEKALDGSYYHDW